MNRSQNKAGTSSLRDSGGSDNCSRASSRRRENLDVALDLDGHAVSQCRAHGLPVFDGDARRTEILRKAHIDEGRALVVTMDDPRAVQHAVQVARKHWPHLPVYARARDSAHARRLLNHGATDVVPESLEAGLQLAARVLEGLGAPLDAVALAIDRERGLELQKLRPESFSGYRLEETMAEKSEKTRARW